MEKAFLRMMAYAERLMDDGVLSWVMAPMPNGNFERMPVTKTVMEELGLVHNQRVNSILVDAIAKASEKELEQSLKKLANSISEAVDKANDEKLDSNFDFRDLMKDGEE